jgi:hypothetical protein
VAEDNKELQLEILSSKKSELFKEKSTHQSNLSELRNQKAKFGIIPPLHIINGINDEQKEIENIDDEICKLNNHCC